jgi:hypothetical protein
VIGVSDDAEIPGTIRSSNEVVWGKQKETTQDMAGFSQKSNCNLLLGK